MLKRLEFPFDTNCVDYRRLETMTHYPSFYTQEICFSECARNLTKKHCGCTLRDYPFRNFLSERWCDREGLECTSRLRQSYEKVCSLRCRVPCSETTYDARPVKSEVTVPVLENGFQSFVAAAAKIYSPDAARDLPYSAEDEDSDGPGNFE
ncbi:hypothetical protein HPB47_020397 [Ixodes persulcatus]|uniref:Uncharacterized protein n=1 Tax=Ixodes persulcatus TaxID=34615 RepID=A0AC60QFJ0_IXOPE|nr:hypothetical protein HPB47_020397 [Ixodes persulcatus]